jgi:pyruvate,orthophosphate dikinase
MSELYVIAANRGLPVGGVDEVGNKAWNLMLMSEAGLPVPPGFVLPTSLCERVEHGSAALLDGLIERGLAELETATGRDFGSGRRPLLLSVRSGAAASMPGMMETVLNVGLNDTAVKGIIRATGNTRLAWDSYRRLIESYAEVVAAVPMNEFHAATAEAVAAAGVSRPADLDFEQCRTLVRALLDIYRDVAGRSFPQDVRVQLTEAVRAVFRSWNAEKAVTFRRINHLNDLKGTAVTVQTMVFGNMSGFSGSGVAFTRDPSSGAPELYLDFATNAQGEDIVAGRQRVADAARLGQILPHVRAELDTLRDQLERRFGDAQDFEFTVEEGKLWLLQTRIAKRTPWAAVRIATDMVQEELITPEDGLRQLEHIDLDAIARRSLVKSTILQHLGNATVASQGIASGRVAFDAAAAVAIAEAGEPAILVRAESNTSDIEGMVKAVGILTSAGGRTSHAAVVARQLDKVCLVGCADLQINARSALLGGHTINAGDWITLDGSDGSIYAGRGECIIEIPTELLAEVERWRAGAHRRHSRPEAVAEHPGVAHTG